MQPYQRLFTLLYGTTAQTSIQSMFDQIMKEDLILIMSLALFTYLSTSMGASRGALSS